ncbi:hypothetical protein D9M68_744140 [compost metagenome]
MVLAIEVPVEGHLLPELADRPRGVCQHGIQRRQAGHAALVQRAIAQVQDAADQHGLGGLLPVVVEALAVRIDDQHRQVLHVANLELGAQADFLQRIPAHAAVGGGRLEAQHAVAGVLLSPAGGQRPQLALEVGDHSAVLPRQQGRDH